MAVRRRPDDADFGIACGCGISVMEEHKKRGARPTLSLATPIEPRVSATAAQELNGKPVHVEL